MLGGSDPPPRETRSSAVEHLKASYSRALEADSPADAAQALEGIARVHLNRGEYDQADELARKALELLQGREDYLHEVCPSQLVLGRALLERGRLDEAEECFRAADAAAEQLASISHRTEAWVALGDLAARRGDGPRGRTSLPERRRGAPGNPLLGKEVAMKPRLLLLLVNLASAGCVAREVRCRTTPGPTGTRNTTGYTRARMRPAAALTVLSCLLLVAGCGGSDARSDGPRPSRRRASTLEELWRAPGDDVAVIPGTANHEPGDVRVSFLVVDAEGASSRFRPRGSGSRTALDAQPFLETEAKLERIGVPGGAEADATHIYVATLRLPRAGKYWLLAEPEGGATKVQALGNVVVVKEDAATRRRRPRDRVRDADARIDGRQYGSTLTTRTPPDESLLRHSVADSLAANVPFVVTFATPKFCASRTCGPVVDVVEEVSAPLRRTTGSASSTSRSSRTTTRPRASTAGCRSGSCRPSRGRSSSAPDGRIAARFEGTVSVNELEQAVARSWLLPADLVARRRARSTTMLRHARHRAQREHRAHERDDVLGLDLLLVREPRPLGHPAWRRNRARSPSHGRRARPPRGSASVVQRDERRFRRCRRRRARASGSSRRSRRA